MEKTQAKKGKLLADGKFKQHFSAEAGRQISVQCGVGGVKISSRLGTNQDVDGEERAKSNAATPTGVSGVKIAATRERGQNKK